MPFLEDTILLAKAGWLVLGNFWKKGQLFIHYGSSWETFVAIFTTLNKNVEPTQKMKKKLDEQKSNYHKVKKVSKIRKIKLSLVSQIEEKVLWLSKQEELFYGTAGYICWDL